MRSSLAHVLRVLTLHHRGATEAPKVGRRTLTDPALKKSKSSLSLFAQYIEPLPELVREPQKFNVLSLSSADVARELTMHDEKLFRAVMPREFLKTNWQRKEKAVLSPNITRIILRVNEVLSDCSAFLFVNPERSLGELLDCDNNPAGGVSQTTGGSRHEVYKDCGGVHATI